jgi:hypothetical protein
VRGRSGDNLGMKRFFFVSGRSAFEQHFRRSHQRFLCSPFCLSPALWNWQAGVGFGDTTRMFEYV